jgi:biopolymer transport protein ExbD
MRRIHSTALPLVAVLLLACGLFAALRLLQQRSWGGAPVTPPTARAGSPWIADDADALLGIDRHGQYYFNRTPIRNATLPAVIDSAFRQLPAGTPLHVYADRALRASVVDEAIRIAQAHGVRRVSLVADETAPR